MKDNLLKYQIAQIPVQWQCAIRSARCAIATEEPEENSASGATPDNGVIILAGKTHHLRVWSTKKAKCTWEGSIVKTHEACANDYLLEFTAT